MNNRRAVQQIASNSKREVRKIDWKVIRAVLYDEPYPVRLPLEWERQILNER